VRALFLLIGLEMRGWVRYLGRNLRTVKGAVLALVGLTFLVVWLVPMAVLPRHEAGFSSETLRLYGPLGLLAYCLINVLLTSGERAVYFTPAEVNFLFSGPFSRRQVLAYKITTTFLIGLPTALILTALLQIHAPWWLAAYVGLVLIFVFLQLFALAVNLVAVSIGASLYTRARKLTLTVALLAAVGLLVLPEGVGAAKARFLAWVEATQGTFVWQPLRWFIDAFLAEDLADLGKYAALALLVNLGLLGLVFALDAQYLEATAASSARIYAQLQRLRGRPGHGTEGRHAGVRLALPALPWWGGVGPTLWRQATTALRNWDRLLILIVVFALPMAGPLLAGPQTVGGGFGFAGTMAGFLLWLTLMLTTLVPFDFRGDVDRMALLKTLPLPAWRLALGQLLTPTLLVSVAQVLVLAGFQLSLPWRDPLLWVCAAFAPPLNFLLFALENLLFLLFPARLVATPGDFQAIGRNVLFLLVKVITLSVVGGVAIATGVVVYLATGPRLLPALASAWLLLAVAGACLVPLVAFAFQLFDVGRDTPP
jgi:hypothetical protein